MEKKRYSNKTLIENPQCGSLGGYGPYCDILCTSNIQDTCRSLLELYGIDILMRLHVPLERLHLLPGEASRTS